MAAAKKCHHCGEWLDNTYKEKSSSTKDSGKKSWIYPTIIAVAVVCIIAVVIGVFFNNTENKVQSGEQTASLVEDYSISQVSFDSKSLLALNLMGQEDAHSLLLSSGWENVGEIGMGEKDDPMVGYIKFADLYLKNNSEDKQIIKHIDGALKKGVGFIEFESSSRPVINSMEKSIADMGFRIARDPSTDNHDDFRYFKEDTVHYPIYGLTLSVNYQDESSSIPLDTTYTWYIKKLPEINK